MKQKILFTSEAVSEGHPDKLCDKIADSILDACINLDKNARVAVEVLITHEKVVIAGEVTLNKSVGTPDYEKIARDVLREIGYTSHEEGIDADKCDVEVLIRQQSADISRGVDSSYDEASLGAGDQGIMFGYASNETENLMPLPIVMAHKLVRRASIYRKANKNTHMRPDMKSQVTIDYTDINNPRVDTIVFSCQHDDQIDIENLRSLILKEVIIPVVESFGMNLDFRTLINPTGRFVIGGPEGDTGVTGRKIIVDTYGGSCPHGGGAFSGKDPTKVDRSAAYAARYAAKNIVASGACDRIQIQLSYAIGVSRPVSIGIETFGTEKVEKEKIIACLNEVFDFTPKGIISKFSMTEPKFKYSDLSNYGHFGRPDIYSPWEELDKVNEIKNFLKL